MIRRWFVMLPLAIGALALGNAAAWPIGLCALGLTALAVGVGPRWDVDTGRQLLTSAIGAGAGYLSCSLLYEAEPEHLGDGWAKLCAAALLAGAARFLLIAPRGGQMATIAFAFAALAFAGKTPAATGYIGLVVAFLSSCVWVLGDATRAGPAPRRLWMGAAVLVLAAGLGTGTSAGLTRLQAWARGRTRITTHAWSPRAGFSDRMDLGALDGLLDSTQRVLRIRGGRIDYLRGASLDVYEAGRWRRSGAGERETRVVLDGMPGAAAIEITALGSRQDRLFIPLEARALRAVPSTMLLDDLGTLHTESKRELPSVRFLPGPRELAKLAEPRPSDLGVPHRVARHVEPLAREWTEGAVTAADKLSALERHLLHEYTYSRTFTRPERSDPVVDFLLANKRGHCEYFASALALLARSVGVPTRVVMGYRVSERSPFGYHVVRERNAHAWVEAWLPGVGWTTHDATPMSAQPFNAEFEASTVASSLDGLYVAYDDLTNWLSQRSLLETSLAWLFGGGVLAVIVARGARRRARRRALADDEVLLDFMKPLIDTLERQGHVRRPDEPLERFAARLPDAETARLVERYSALRYGGDGDQEDLARAVAVSAREKRRRPRLPA